MGKLRQMLLELVEKQEAKKKAEFAENYLRQQINHELGAWESTGPFVIGNHLFTLVEGQIHIESIDELPDEIEELNGQS